MQRKVYLLVLLVLFVQDLFGQCAMCKAVAETSTTEEGNNINRGILFIMIIPYIILFIAFRKKIFAFIRQFKEVPKSNGRV